MAEPSLFATVLPYSDKCDTYPVDPEKAMVEYMGPSWKEASVEDIRAEMMSPTCMLLFNCEWYKRGPLNCHFDAAVRGRAPYAPLFKGNLIVLDTERPWDPEYFAELAAAKWSKPPEDSAEEASEFARLLSTLKVRNKLQ